MASVRITQEIRTAVFAKIRALFDDRINKKFAELTNLDVGIQVFLQQVDPKELELAKQLNLDVQWIPTIQVLQVRIEYTGIDGAKRQAVFTVPFKPPVPAPTSFHGYSANSTKNMVTPNLACYQPCVDVLLQHDALVQEREALLTSIGKLLNECGTLRQVLDRWPTALDFMPEDVRKRHYLKSDTKTRKEISEVDDHTKMLLMKARMINGV